MRGQVRFRLALGGALGLQLAPVLDQLLRGVHLKAELQLERHHGRVIVAGPLGGAPVVNHAEHATFHHRLYLANRQVLDVHGLAHFGQLGQERDLARHTDGRAERGGKRAVIDVARCVRANDGVRLLALELIDAPQSLEAERVRGRRFVVALIAEVFQALVIGPPATAHERAHVTGGERARLLVEERGDPVLAVSLPPDVLQPLFLVAEPARDLPGRLADGEDRRPMLLEQLPLERGDDQVLDERAVDRGARAPEPERVRDLVVQLPERLELAERERLHDPALEPALERQLRHRG